MIFSHDSLTYLEPRWMIFAPFRWLWRTQDKTYVAQINAGVRYFDIRVRRHKGKWRACHGLVDFNLMFDSLSEIARIFCDCNHTYCRIILERGEIESFVKEIPSVMDHDGVRQIVIKKGWQMFKDMGPGGEDLTYIPWMSGLGFWENLKRFRPGTIKRYAKRHNPPITQDMIEDMDKTYVMDYV